MPKRNSASDKAVPGTKQQATGNREKRYGWFRVSLVACRLSLPLAHGLLVGGCATPQYAIRQTPVPDESASALHIERTISAIQGQEFERHGGEPLGDNERLRGLEIQRTVDRLSRVTERPSLRYRASLYHDQDPNAAALADGRIYISTGMVNYLASRGSRADELAFVLSHELAHTVAQHLVKRYRTLQQQQLLMAIVAAGTAAATRDASTGLQQAGKLALDVASLLGDVANSGYSQDQELEADQLGIRYVIRAGFDPEAALDLLQDFSRFENPWPFLRTHPYILQRREDLRRYLSETGHLRRQTPLADQPGNSSMRSDRFHDRSDLEERLRQLRQAQQLYPEGSVSWKNLQRQIEALERP
jgi:predicted Zn-dependent protease